MSDQVKESLFIGTMIVLSVIGVIWMISTKTCMDSAFYPLYADQCEAVICPIPADDLVGGDCREVMGGCCMNLMNLPTYTPAPAP